MLGGNRTVQEERNSEVVSVPVASIPTMLANGEITDGKSMIGLFAYLHQET